MNVNLSTQSLLEHFSVIEDPRIERHKKYPLLNILVYTFVAILSDQQSWYEIQAFAKANLSWFSKYLDVASGVPSHDTFRRVFSMLDPEELEKSIIEWTEGLRRKKQSPNLRVVALDGKALKGVRWKVKPDDLYTLNAWDSNENMFLGQVTIGQKTNEIKEAPRLLNLLNLENAVVTTDALLTQKKVAKNIIEKSGDYVMALKGNHAEFFREVKEYFNGVEEEGEKQVEKNQGKVEIRQCQVGHVEWFEDKKDWPGLKEIIKIDYERHYEGKVKKVTRYYISSLKCSAIKYLQIVRSHWGIENGLHRTLDVYFKEDASQEHDRNAATNLSVLRKIALTLLKAIDPQKKLKLKLKEAAFSPEFRARCLIGEF